MTRMARYVCPVCGFTYDEGGQNARWSELPGDWLCPVCGAEKSTFEPEIDAPVAGAASETAGVVGEVAVAENRLVSLERLEETNALTSKTQPPLARNTPIEPTVEFIHSLARDGLEKTGHHGPVGAMGVPRTTLPAWDDIQILPAQLATKPLPESTEVGTELILGPNAKRPLRLKIPILVSDMSFGALSEEAKTALAKGAELAGTGICSGEGGMLPEEQAANSRYLFELGSARFGFSEEVVSKVQAFHFKAGQAAKTGTGGHLPGTKVTARIAQVRKIAPGQAAISPPTFPDLATPEDYRRFADRIRDLTGGIPIGMKMSAQHIEADIEFALQAGVDYIILDGRGGATGAAPLIFRDNISVPTIPGLARARRYLDERGRHDVTLIVTGGLRTPADFIKALCLGADGIAVANAAIQAIGCIAARICDTNNCPSGIATQQEHLRARLNIDDSATRLNRFLSASVELMKVMARACAHTHLNQFAAKDIATWKRDMADLAGISYCGAGRSDRHAQSLVITPSETKRSRENPMSTQDNLQAAFAGESQANRSYLAFAAKADAEGHPQIARLFRAAAAAETIHAHAHLRVMGGIKDTKLNLQAAIAGEGHEFKEMYPAFIKQAEAEGNKAALVSFRNANAVEEVHYNLYSNALEALEAGTDLPPQSIHVCEICGNTVVGDAPDKCDVCGAPRTKFTEVA